MNTIKLNNTDSIDSPYGDVTHVVQLDDCLEIVLESDEKNPEYKCIWITGKNSNAQISFKEKIKIQFFGNIEVVCDDWSEDVNIPKSSLDESWMRWNELSDMMEFNHERLIGNTVYDLPIDYLNHIDLNYGNIEKIYFDRKYGKGKFHFILNANFNDPEGETIGFYTGPFHFYCDNVNLIID